ncbi:MAG: flagellar export protein FliJ [Candidatus Hydrogenedentes bacterium]|nr:flagellar export protein FliJ [Candidatus Hydrogenedentota bacterium]
MSKRDLERMSLLARIKRLEERLCAQEFSKVRKNIVSVEDRIGQVNEEKGAVFRCIEDSFLTSNMEEVNRYYDYANYLEKEKDTLISRLEELKKEEELKRAELEKKMQKRKIFENLKDRKEEHIINWINKEFQKTLDDIIISRWNKV